MSFSGKKTIASIVAGITALAGYAVYAFGDRAPAADDLRGWAVSMLWLIGIGVVVAIVAQILCHIAAAVGIAAREPSMSDKAIERNMSSLMVEDERDRLINLKSAHIGYIVCGIGFVLTLITLSMGISSVAALHVLFCAFAAGSIIEGIISVYLYEKGRIHG